MYSNVTSIFRKVQTLNIENKKRIINAIYHATAHNFLNFIYQTYLFMITSASPEIGNNNILDNTKIEGCS